MHKTIAAVSLAFSLGVLVGVFAVRPAAADAAGDIHRITVASEQIARALDKCPR